MVFCVMSTKKPATKKLTKKWSHRQALRDFIAWLDISGFLIYDERTDPKTFEPKEEFRSTEDIYILIDQFLGIDLNEVQKEGRKK